MLLRLGLGITTGFNSAAKLLVEAVFVANGSVVSRDSSTTTTDAREIYFKTRRTVPEQANLLNFFISESILLDDISNYGPVGLHWKPDGTRFFIADNHDNQIATYDCSTPWDISTHSYNASASADISAIQVGDAQNTAEISDVIFTPDGTRMFVPNWNQQNTLHVFDLSTAWDPSTFTRVEDDELSWLDEGAGGSNGYHPDIRDCYFIDDGETLIIVNGEHSGDLVDNDIRYYPLGTAWDPSSITVNVNTYEDSRNLTISAPAQIRGLDFSEDGTRMFIVDKELQRVRVFDLTTGFDASTATENHFEAIDLNIVTENSFVAAIQWRGNFEQLFIVDAGNDTMYTYEKETQ